MKTIVAFSTAHYERNIRCSSWRLAVETNNIIRFKTVPAKCKDYIRKYILGKQYSADTKEVLSEAYSYAKSIDIIKGGNYTWVFNIDDTLLSNVQYYASRGFGTKPRNVTSFNHWIQHGKSRALPHSLKLYNKLLGLHYKIVLITKRPESQRKITVKNLRDAGYRQYAKIIFKDTTKERYIGKTTLVYKSHERKILEKEGFRIIGNIGDQWSDILGTSASIRSFKLPNPLY
ncbi:putative Acid phosphatase [Lupinus albus]|uniref:Putative Acid phosphatase n=1 Tax=Lupinus albus TaxID=3870 RepID=A0A6A4NBG6_LUPAL|nr:putative Acid phosphatase [Lupinus albus]